jgi:hypothetical protein
MRGLPEVPNHMIYRVDRYFEVYLLVGWVQSARQREPDVSRDPELREPPEDCSPPELLTERFPVFTMVTPARKSTTDMNVNLVNLLNSLSIY